MLDTLAIQKCRQAARDDNEQALLTFTLATGIAPGSLAALRWQHVDMALQTIAVPSLAGQVMRTIPLTLSAKNTLLSMRARKLGPIFKLDAAQTEAALSRMALAAGASLQSIYQTAAQQWTSLGFSAEQVTQLMGLNEAHPPIAPLSVGKASPLRAAFAIKPRL